MISLFPERIPQFVVGGARLLPQLLGTRRRGYRLWDRVLRIALPGILTGEKRVPFGSIDLVLDLNDYIERLMAYQLHGEESYASLRYLLRPGDVMVDAGAHVGYYTAEAARRVGPTGRVVAIEANPAIHPRLTTNLKAMGRHVTTDLIAKALAESVGSASFIPDAVASWSRLSAEGSANSSTQSIPTTTLDALASPLGKITLLKLDIEGAELAALRGARNLLGSPEAPAFILCEINRPALAAQQASAEAIVELLAQLGYKAYGLRWIDAVTPEYEVLESIPSEQAFDLLFARPEILAQRWPKV